MPKKSTGYTPKKGKQNPVAKEAVPMKAPSIDDTKMPKTVSTPKSIDGGPNNVASLPGSRFPKLTKPMPMAPRTPKI